MCNQKCFVVNVVKDEGYTDEFVIEVYRPVPLHPLNRNTQAINADRPLESIRYLYTTQGRWEKAANRSNYVKISLFESELNEYKSKHHLQEDEDKRRNNFFNSFS